MKKLSIFFISILLASVCYAERMNVETAGGAVSDAIYGAGWNDDTTTAPSKNAVYDKIETLGGGHDAVTLGADADVLLGLSIQQLTLDSQSANTIFAGPGSGAAADPTFRALVNDDVPDTITLTNITQITTRSHTLLTDIGTNTHAQIDTHIAAANPHSDSLNKTLTSASIYVGNATNVATVTAVTGDINITASGVTAVQANAVALTDDTTGNYVASVATTAPLTGGAGGSEGAALTIAIPKGNSTVDGYINATDWGTFNGKVSTTRSITIAGTANEITSSAGAQDLSADRTWTISLPATIDLGGKTSFEIPNGASPTVDAAGKIAQDTTDDQLLYGATPRVLAYTYERCFGLETPVVGDDNVPIWSPNDAITISSMYCRTQGGTSAELQVSDGTNVCESIVCNSTGQADDGTLVNNTFTANERMEFDTIAVTGSVTWVNYCIRYTVDRQ